MDEKRCWWVKYCDGHPDATGLRQSPTKDGEQEAVFSLDSSPGADTGLAVGVGCSADFGRREDFAPSSLSLEVALQGLSGVRCSASFASLVGVKVNRRLR